MVVEGSRTVIRRILLDPLLWLGISLGIAAAAQVCWLAPQMNRLPEAGVDESRFDATIRSRDSPTGEWVDSRGVVRRIDRTLLYSGRHVVIQGDLDWSDGAGAPTFHNTGIYGVDRYTRMNLPGYGDVARNGQFVFPMHVARRDYRYWDPQFTGPRVAVFDRAEMLAGLPVLVFRFAMRDLDQTTGYDLFADAPERYRAVSEGDGWLWVEPISGTLVDYQESGSSAFVEPASRRRIVDFYRWSLRFSAPTRSGRLARALSARRRIIATEIIAPTALALLGLGCLLGAVRRLRRPPTTGAAAALRSA